MRRSARLGALVGYGCAVDNGRGGQIRTGDPLHPMQVRYRAALRPAPTTPAYHARLPFATRRAVAHIPLVDLQMKQDCYSILGVPRTASPGEIRVAYRRLARLYHPDLNSGAEAEARMQQINGAYATLSDPDRRRQYDLHGTISAAPPANPNQPSRTGPRRGAARPRDQIPQRGEDLEVCVLINSRDASRGVRKSFLVERMETCPRCRGTGLEPEEIAIAGRCWRCGGEQRLSRILRLNATIPAGVVDGNRLRLRGQGNAGIDGGANGHVYLTTRFVPNKGLGRVFAFILRHLFYR